MEETLEFIIDLIYKGTAIILMGIVIISVIVFIVKIMSRIVLLCMRSRTLMILIIPVNREKLKKQIINNLVREYLIGILDEENDSSKRINEVKSLSRKCFESCYKIANTELYELTDGDLEKINYYCREYKS